MSHRFVLTLLKGKIMNKKLIVSVVAGAAAIFLGNVAYAKYQASQSTGG